MMEFFAHMAEDPVTWVGVSFLFFVAGVLYLKAPAMVARMLDERIDKIRGQLDEARTLREEAQALLAQYQRKQREVTKEAEGMVALSKEEAGIFAKEAEASLDALIERRTKAAQDKIAQAQAQAVAEVRAAAVEVAVGAAERVLRERLGGKKAAADPFVKKAIEDIDKSIH